MTDKKLIKITTQFTKGIIGKDTTKGKCFMVCSALQSYLTIMDVKCKLIKGVIKVKSEKEIWNHFWLKLNDGRILDPTADQFLNPDGSTRQMVFLDMKPNWYIVPKF